MHWAIAPKLKWVGDAYMYTYCAKYVDTFCIIVLPLGCFHYHCIKVGVCIVVWMFKSDHL